MGACSVLERLYVVQLIDMDAWRLWSVLLSAPRPTIHSTIEI